MNEIWPITSFCIISHNHSFYILDGYSKHPCDIVDLYAVTELCPLSDPLRESLPTKVLNNQ